MAPTTPQPDRPSTSFCLSRSISGCICLFIVYVCVSRNLYATFPPFWIAVCANIIGIIKRWSFEFLLYSSFYVSFNNVPNAFHIYLLFLFLMNTFILSLSATLLSRVAARIQITSKVKHDRSMLGALCGAIAE